MYILETTACLEGPFDMWRLSELVWFIHWLDNVVINEIQNTGPHICVYVVRSVWATLFCQNSTSSAFDMYVALFETIKIQTPSYTLLPEVGKQHYLRVTGFLCAQLSLVMAKVILIRDNKIILFKTGTPVSGTRLKTQLTYIYFTKNNKKLRGIVANKPLTLPMPRLLSFVQITRMQCCLKNT